MTEQVESILKEAENIIYGDREKTYGAPDKNLLAIAGMWQIIFGIPVSVPQVCQAMIAVKLSRLVNDPRHRDSWVDIVGYSALLDRCGYIQQKK